MIQEVLIVGDAGRSSGVVAYDSGRYHKNHYRWLHFYRHSEVQLNVTSNEWLTEPCNRRQGEEVHDCGRQN